jgi:hypothetical protein
MEGWNVFGDVVKGLPPIVGMVFLVTAGVLFLIGFSRHGMDFLQHGFKQTALGASLEKRFDNLDARIDGLQTKIEGIEVNHFGHLKGYLEMLDGILLDKNIITNKEKAMLDSQLRGM